MAWLKEARCASQTKGRCVRGDVRSYRQRTRHYTPCPLQSHPERLIARTHVLTRAATHPLWGANAARFLRLFWILAHLLSPNTSSRRRARSAPLMVSSPCVSR
jgi:hypothetical protein